MPGLPAACACLRQPEHLTIPALTSLSLERPTVPALVSPSPGAPSKVPVPISSWGARADGVTPDLVHSGCLERKPFGNPLLLQFPFPPAPNPTCIRARSSCLEIPLLVLSLLVLPPPHPQR